MTRCFGMILAAGLGIRMGAPKAFLRLDGKPILLYSLLTFERSARVDGIGVVCRPEDREAVHEMAKASSIQKLGFVIPGGKERQDSVFAGMNSIPKKTEIVAIHDAARPLLTLELLEAVLKTAEEKKAAIAAIPMKDTVKLVTAPSARGSSRASGLLASGNPLARFIVKETLNRNAIWLAQTPQAFQAALFKKALLYARKENFYGTDCASVMEHYGKPVWIVEGTPENFKITTALDLLLAEALQPRLHV